MIDAKCYPKLLAPLDNPGATGHFVVSDGLPPEDLIGNAYMAPRVGPDWLYFVQADGRLQLPGGKKEPGESHREALERELLEEVGAEILSASPVGYWLLRSKRTQPYRAHLPHPESAGVVYCGSLRLVCEPTNPAGTGATREVRVAPLPDVVSSFRGDDREDLAELYLLANALGDPGRDAGSDGPRA